MNTIVEKVKVNGLTLYPRTKLTTVNPEEVKSADLPAGRVSIEETVTFAQLIKELSVEFSSSTSKFPIEYLEVMQNLSLVNPDVSQAVDNIVQLGNSGHKVLIETSNDKQQELILQQINDFNSTAFHNFGGVDGFINSLLGQLARGGAASVEWVPEINLNSIEKVVFVPLSTVRFSYNKEDDRYLPYQKTNNILEGTNGYVALNETTYQYCALQLLDNSPYAVPPILAALESIMIQRDIIKNFKFVARKMGLLGFVTFLLKAPQRQGGETDSTYLTRCKSFLEEQANTIKHNYRDGMAIGFKDNFTVEHHSLMGSAQGASEIFKEIEMQVFSGLKADPALHGRTYSTTETYAGVVYEKMLAVLTNYQRIVKQVLEYGYKLHLTMLGLNYNSLVVEFEVPKSLSSERDEQTYTQKLTNLEKLYDQGIISQETFAQEAGYETPDLPEPRVGRGFDFPTLPDTEEPEDSEESDTQENKLIDFLESALTPLREKIHKRFHSNCNCEYKELVSLAENRPSIKKLRKFVNEYFRNVYPSIKGSRIKAIKEVDKFLKSLDPTQFDSEQFADEVFNKLDTAFGRGFAASVAGNEIRKNLTRIYKHFRLIDADPFPNNKLPIQPQFNLVDENALKFLRNSDDFYFGRYINDNNTKKSLKKWLVDDYLQNGRSLRDKGELDKFRIRFGNRVAKEDYKILRVVETSVTRAKNWGNALTIEEAGATEITIAGPKDNLTCDWCEEMVDKSFTVSPVVSHIKDVISHSPEQLPQLSPFLPGKIRPEVLGELDEDQLLAQGIALPPYHPYCRHRFVVTGFD